ncbi:MAG: alpha-glucosidase [Propionibacteriaceae bacterium]|jgi:oligo-1,6-glucosidase|nr:alpha-glucosidase [Propionibacteriaceae bacterium]
MTTTPDFTLDSDPWWRNAVVYQIYPRSFADSDGDGVGDLRGIIGRLGHLRRLGVDVIWLSPIYRSPQADNGYDISDYQAIDPLFGDLDAFDALLAAVHEQGMKLMMDLVVNHTSDEHAWFAAARSSRDDPHRDWYWWRDPRPGHEPGTPGAEPNNWRSFFGGPAWGYDSASGQYYLHLFDTKQPDLNWENPEVRQAVYRMMGWWLDRGVDGFRMDVINLISKNAALPDGVEGGDGLGDGSPFYSDGPRVHEFLHEMHETVFASRPGRFITVGETPGVTVEEAQRYTDPGRGEVDMVFQFDHVDLGRGPAGKFDPAPIDLLAFKAIMDRWQTGLARTGWNSLYLNNHDQPRSVSRFGDDVAAWRDSATAWATVLHLHRGTPYVYQGEEIGMTNFPFQDIAQFRDVESLNHYRISSQAGASPEAVLPGLAAHSRDNARTPVQWDAGAEAGFTSGTPWIAVNPNYSWLNAAAQVDDAGSVFQHYRRLIDLRHRDRILVDGVFHMLLPDHRQVYAFERRTAVRCIVVVANLSAQPVEVVVPVRGMKLWFTNRDDHDIADPDSLTAIAESDELVLEPWEARVYDI